MIDHDSKPAVLTFVSKTTPFWAFGYPLVMLLIAEEKVILHHSSGKNDGLIGFVISVGVPLLVLALFVLTYVNIKRVIMYLRGDLTVLRATLYHGLILLGTVFFAIYLIE